MSNLNKSDIKRIVMRSHPKPGPNLKQCYFKNHYAGPFNKSSEEVGFWLDQLTKQGQRWSLVIDNADRAHIYAFSGTALPVSKIPSQEEIPDGGSWMNGEPVKC